MVDNNSITEWISSGVMWLLSLLGLGKIVELLFGRYLKKQDEKEQAEIVTEGKKIEADVKLIETLIKRVETLEANQTKLNETLMSLTDKNARLDNERINLRRENAEQKRKIEQLELTLRALQAKYEELARQLAALDPAESSKILAAAEQAEKISLRSASQWASRESFPVMIVEDDRDTRLLLHEAFKAEKIPAIGFANGTEALEWLENNEASVIILDLALSPIDGLTLAGHIRTNEARYKNRRPADIAFYTGRAVDDIVLGIKERHNVREVFVKATDDPMAVAQAVKGWLAGN